MKKQWIAPKLIVLEKGKAEENVLLICKQYHHMEGQAINPYCVPPCYHRMNNLCCPAKVTGNS